MVTCSVCWTVKYLVYWSMPHWRMTGWVSFAQSLTADKYFALCLLHVNVWLPILKRVYTFWYQVAAYITSIKIFVFVSIKNPFNPCLGPFNSLVLRSCMVLQCSHPPQWPCHQRRLANCDWMPASYTSGQPSYSCRHPTCWASSQRSYAFSSTPCHGAWTYGRITDGRRSGWSTLRDSVLSSLTPASALPEWRSQEQRRSSLNTSAPACSNGVWPPLRPEEKAVDPVVLQCSTHWPPHGLHSLTVVDDETIKWLLNTCPEI